jgi:hypothetical protein
MLSTRIQRVVSVALALALGLSAPARALAGPGAVGGQITQAFGNKPVQIVNPQEGQVPVLTNGKWVAGAPSVTSSSLDALFGTTQGSVIYRGASGWVSLGPGSNGQILTSGGASANVSWTSVSTSQTLAQTLAQGFVTGANNIQVTLGQFIQFGGATSSFPALHRNGSNGILETRLADDSAGSVFGATEVWFGGAGSYDVGIRRVSGGKIQITDTGTTDRDLQAGAVTLSSASGLTLTNAPGADTCIVTADQTHSGGSFTFLWLGPAGSRTTGLYQSSGGVLNVTDTGATNYATLGNGGSRLQAAGVRGWSSTSDATAAADAGFSRVSGSIIALGNGSAANASGELRCLSVTTTGANALTVKGGQGSGGGFSLGATTVTGILTTGNLYTSDNSYGLGQVASRWANLYIADNVIWTNGSGTADAGVVRSAANVVAATQGSGTSANGEFAAAAFRATVHASSTGTTSIDATATVWPCDTTSAGFTITLPTASGIAGRVYVIKKMVAANTLTIGTTSSQTIDGSTTVTVTTLNQSYTLVSDGSNWLVE